MGDQYSIPIPTKPDLAALRRSFQSIKTALNDISSSVSSITSGSETSDTSALLLSSLGADWKEVLTAASPFINDLSVTYNFSSSTISQTMAKADVINNTIILSGTVTNNVYLYLYWTASRGSKHYRIKNNLTSSTTGLVVYIKTTTGSISLPIPSGITDINVLADGTIQNLGYGIIAQGQNSSGYYVIWSSGLCEQWGTATAYGSIGSANGLYGSTSGTMYYVNCSFTFPLAFLSSPFMKTGSNQFAWPIPGSSYRSATQYSIQFISPSNNFSATTEWYAYGFVDVLLYGG